MLLWMNKLSGTIRHADVADINIHLEQKTLIEKCSVNKGVLKKAVMHCTAMLLW